jgi:hypothetical protein
MEALRGLDPLIPVLVPLFDYAGVSLAEGALGA